MLLPKRIWRDIPGYEGLYQVSNDGKVRSLNYNHTGKKQILKQYTNKEGYKRIALSKNNKLKWYLVHRLVALAFIPNPNNWPQVNHKDENKANNYVNNLEWMSHKDNCNYGTRNERHSKAMKGYKHTKEARNKMSKAQKGKRKGKDNPNSKPILMFTKNGDFIKRFDSVGDANEYLGKDRHNDNISLCARPRSKNKTAWGYKWKYEEDCK